MKSRAEELLLMLPPRLARWAEHVVAGELLFHVPAELICAVMDRESLGGDANKPQGPGGFGDHGHGFGLMQIDSRFHHSFCVALDDMGLPLWKDPAFNIMYGTRLLAQNYRLLSADWTCAVGAYNAGVSKVRCALGDLGVKHTRAELVSALDGITANGDYVSDVLRRWKNFGGKTGAV